MTDQMTLLSWKKVLPWLLAYALVLIFGVVFHEPWRDEIQAFALARSADSFVDLLTITKYEGHPSLWFLVLHLGTWISDSTLVVKIIHTSINLAAATLLLRYAPFKLIAKIAILFSYFFLFEYGVVARSYSLGILLSFTALILLQKKKYAFSICALAALFHVSIYSWIIAAGLSGLLVFSVSHKSIKNGVATFSILGVSAALSFIDILRPADAQFGGQFQFSLVAIQSALSEYAATWIPVPSSLFHFHNSSIVHAIPDPFDLGVKLLIVMLSCILLLFLTRHSKQARLTGGFILLGLFAFTAFRFLGEFRHLGHFLLVFILAAWIASIFKNEESSSFFEKVLFKKISTGFLALIFIAQLLAAVNALAQEFIHPFSHSKNVAEYLTNNNIQSEQILGYPDYTTAAINTYRKQPIQFAHDNRAQDFVVWDTQRRLRLKPTLVLHTLDSIKQQTGAAYFICNSESLADLGFKLDDFILEISFSPAIIEDEQFYLFIRE